MNVILRSVAKFLDDFPMPHERAEEIARRICFHFETADPVEFAVLNPQDRSDAEVERARDVIRERRDKAPDGEAARERLFLSTGPSSTQLDGYLLEFLIRWGRLAGIPEDDIETAVLGSLPEFRTQASH